MGEVSPERILREGNAGEITFPKKKMRKSDFGKIIRNRIPISRNRCTGAALTKLPVNPVV